DVEVAGGAAAGTDLTAAGELDPVAGVDARGHRDGDRAAVAHASLAGALGAGVGDGRAVAAAGGAGRGRHDVAEEGARHPLDRAAAVAHGAGLHARARAGARAVAGAAQDGGVDLDLLLDAEDGVPELDLEADEGVLAAPAARRGATAGAAGRTEE